MPAFCLDSQDMFDRCREAVEIARLSGAIYADCRVVYLRRQEIAVEDDRPEQISETESCGIGVRVAHAGGWGFAATPYLERNAIAAAADQALAMARAACRAAPDLGWAEEPPARGIFETPVQIDPFAVSLDEKISLLLAISRAARAIKGVRKCQGGMQFKCEHRFFVNSENAEVESRGITSAAKYVITAVDEHTAKTRYFEAYPLNAGYEHIRAMPLLEQAPRVAEEAVRKLRGRPCPKGRRDLVLLPSHLALTMHESIGHATELDRVLGMEESLAGSSFATVDLLGKLRYGSAAMNILCDNTMPQGLATRGWDDDGVAGQRWHIIRDGILIDYQTSRQVCRAIGSRRSRGSCRADSWASVPIVRQSNLGLEPGPEPLTLEEMIADVKEGILIDGMGSFSIDQRRLNFQFGGDAFWEIRRGKIGEMLADATYRAITTEFWGSLDAVCDRRFWEPRGVMNCGKGDPMQIAQMTHGSAPARFRKICVGDA